MSRTDNGPVGRTLPTKGASGGGRMAKVVKTRAWAVLGGVRVGGKYYKIKVIDYDDESTPARGAQLAERLINQDGVKFMLGPYSSGLTKAIAPVTEKYRIPHVQGNG